MRPTFVKLELGLVSKPQFDAVIPAHLAWLAELERNRSGMRQLDAASMGAGVSASRPSCETATPDLN